MTELPFIGKGEHAYGLLDLMHSDVCGPLMPKVDSSTSLSLSMIVHDLGICIL